jgi:hypothetical protein
MNNRWFGENIYNTVGKVLGYGLAPLSISGFALPIYLRISLSAQKVLGYCFLSFCILTILCNAYLVCRKKRLGHGASMFPVVVTLTGVPTYFLLASPHGYWSVIAVVLIVLFDFLGQSIVAVLLCRVFGLTRNLHIDSKCF